MKQHAGFTLLELLLVLVLVGIASVFAIASVDRLALRLDQRRWFDLTQQALYRLRNQALLGGAPVTALLDFDQGLLLAAGAADQPPLLALPEHFHFLPDTTGTQPPDGSRLALTFLPDGSAFEAAFRLSAPSNEQRRYRLLRVTGKIERTEVDAAR